MGWGKWGVIILGGLYVASFIFVGNQRDDTDRLKGTIKNMCKGYFEMIDGRNVASTNTTHRSKACDAALIQISKTISIEDLYTYEKYTYRMMRNDSITPKIKQLKDELEIQAFAGTCAWAEIGILYSEKRKVFCSRAKGYSMY